jgi:FkbM family methyltransferase
MLASDVCRAFTCSFEPDSEAVRALRRNIAVQELKPITLHTLALGDREDEVFFTAGAYTISKIYF